jgi:predicted transcriptional regulator
MPTLPQNQPDFSALIDHPDKDDIMSKLMSGITPKDISQFLKVKYPTDKKMQLSIKLLEDFAKSFEDIYQQQLLVDLSAQSKNQKINKKLANSLLNNKTYQERINEHLDKEIDLKKKIQQVLTIVESRCEQLFDSIQMNGGDFSKGDYALIKYLELLMNLIEKADKLINNAPDQIVQHNVTIQTIENQSMIFQNVVRRVLTKLDPELSILFMSEFTEELQKMQPEKTQILTQTEKMLEIGLLEEKLEKI